MAATVLMTSFRSNSLLLRMEGLIANYGIIALAYASLTRIQSNLLSGLLDPFHGNEVPGPFSQQLQAPSCWLSQLQ